MFACTDGLPNGVCTTNDTLSISTTFSVYHRHATFTTARSNFSVISVQELDTAVQEMELDIENLKLSFSWLFNFSAANIPAPSAAAYYFWALGDQLSDEMWSIEPYRALQSLMAFPFWHFQENNYGNVRLQRNGITPGLSSEFYTTAAIGSPYLQIIVDR